MWPRRSDRVLGHTNVGETTLLNLSLGFSNSRSWFTVSWQLDSAGFC